MELTVQNQFISLSHLKENIFTQDLGIVKTTVPKSCDMLLKLAFSNFLKQSKAYKNSFLQCEFEYGFDGYSFMGQENSSNQYASDLLHSFVLSEFSQTKAFPVEFHWFLTKQWNPLISKIKSIELKLIEQLKIPGLKELYNESIGHMVSCNYYPKLDSFHQ
mgnify:CR=1 FL=1